MNSSLFLFRTDNEVYTRKFTPLQVGNVYWKLKGKSIRLLLHMSSYFHCFLLLFLVPFPRRVTERYVEVDRASRYPMNTHTHTRARAHARTWIYNYYYCCISFARISDELLQKLDYLVHSVATRYLESFEMWCWRMMEKISWTDRVRLDSVKDEQHILRKKKEDR
jgi:hypothetical protein